MKNSSVAPFSELIRTTWTTVKERKSLILFGGAGFLILNILLQSAVLIPGMETMDPQGMNGQAAAAFGGIIAGIGITSMLLGMLNQLYFYLVATQKNATVATLIPLSLKRLLPYIGLLFLILWNSYAWVAVIGGIMIAIGTIGAAFSSVTETSTVLFVVGTIFVATGVVVGIIRGPRLLLSPILWLMEGKSISASVKRSYDVSAGYWGKIIGNLLLLTLIFALVSLVVSIVLTPFGSMGMANNPWGIDVIVTALLSQFFMAFCTIFVLQLTATIVMNAKKGTVKSKK